MTIRIQAEPFDLGSVSVNFAESAKGAGAIVTFAGVVRGDDDLVEMVIEHYPGMTERAVGKIRDEAMARWSLMDALVMHRFGCMAPGELIMMVATASRHRGDAFAAAEFLMDYLKSRAPFWKKERRAAGGGWVAARDEDERSLDRWQRG